ncbi:MAG: S-adenosylmethionine:tRNA ribosyltransferase-isomerase, partial [Blastocatellia bacterium]
MLVSDFDYHLPDDLIAQKPAGKRDLSRLLVLDRTAESYFDSVFDQLPNHLQRGDVLVLNNTRVCPARLIGRRVKVLRSAEPAKPASSNPRDEIGSSARGARVEIFLVREVEPLVWEALVRPGRALPIGATIEFGESELTGEIVERFDSGRRLIRFQPRYDFDRVIDRIGQTPLPPYIKRPEVNDDQLRLDAERYQTVYATARGAIAAPTAGLHFTPELLDCLRANGVEIVEITLHVGYGTFQPVRVETVEDHKVEPETYTITDDVAVRLNRALAERRRVIAVGTTTTRALESAAIRGEIPGSSSQSTT